MSNHSQHNPNTAGTDPATQISNKVTIRQQQKEGLLAIGLALLYALWWWLSSYGVCAFQAGNNTNNQPTAPTFYAGVPTWFLLSCIIGPIVFTVLCAIMVRWGYQDRPLQPELPTPEPLNRK